MNDNKTYDIVYLTNTPSFYKLNLCDEIGRRGVKVLLVLYGYGSEAVNTQLNDNANRNFDYEFINNGDSNRRNKLATFVRLIRLMSRIKVRVVLYAGWLAPEYNFYSFISPKSKNAMICESSILDVSLSGVKGWMKRKIIGRMSSVLPSGEPHKQLFDTIGFAGRQFITGSVGIFNKANRLKKLTHTPLKYLFVGRLIEAKEVEMLVNVFNRNGLPLTIVGDGRLKDRLHKLAKENISFTGFIQNEELGTVYSEHDIFILPSKYEPWGLVVEEALYRGLPVIVSDRVGSGVDMVKNLNTGEIFRTGDMDDLQSAIEQVSGNYSLYRKAVDSIDWEQRDKNQIDAYIKLLF